MDWGKQDNLTIETDLSFLILYINVVFQKSITNYMYVF